MNEKVTGIDKHYNDRTHTYGRIWSFAAIAVFMLIPLLISIHLHEWPTAGAFGSALVMYAVSGIGGIGEDIMYTTLIGPSATYVSFLTGNMANLKFPCVSAAVESADVDIHSDEGEVVATIAATVSSIVTTLIIAVFCIALSPLIPHMTDPNGVFYPAFKQVLPAIFGAIALPYYVRHPRLWEIPFATMVILYLAVPSLKVSNGMFICVAVSLLCAVVMQKLGLLKMEKNTQ
ncbi:MAG: hypothetical protein MJ129_00985 [Clostridia bacterium]|nr:hypothetical protein [Clostridia bacterium]